jgi:hypothetical protein
VFGIPGWRRNKIFSCASKAACVTIAKCRKNLQFAAETSSQYAGVYVASNRYVFGSLA